MTAESKRDDYIPMQFREHIFSPVDKPSADLRSSEATFKPAELETEKVDGGQFLILLKSARKLRDATVPQTGREHGFVRLLWVFIYIGLVVTFSILFSELVKKYMSYPTLIEIQIVSEPRLEFPAVTVCNENPVKKSLIGRMTNYSDLLILDDYVRSTVKNFAQSAFRDRSKIEPCPQGIFFLICFRIFF